MKTVQQAFSIAGYNFRLWKKNPRIIVTFALTFIMCFLLTDKAVRFAIKHNTAMQMVESFIWSFGDSNSILLSSVLLVMLFADMPFLSSGTPFYLVRTDRRTWITGQVIYILAATAVYLAFVLVSTVILSIQQSFIANMWSPTAAILGYTNAGERVAIPTLVKTLEMSWPYQSMVSIFALMLGYTTVMVLLMLVCNLQFGQVAGWSAFWYSVCTESLCNRIPSSSCWICRMKPTTLPTSSSAGCPHSIRQPIICTISATTSCPGCGSPIASLWDCP